VQGTSSYLSKMAKIMSWRFTS